MPHAARRLKSWRGVETGSACTSNAHAACTAPELRFLLAAARCIRVGVKSSTSTTTTTTTTTKRSLAKSKSKSIQVRRFLGQSQREAGFRRSASTERANEPAASKLNLDYEPGEREAGRPDDRLPQRVTESKSHKRK